MNFGKCPKCEKVLQNAIIEDMPIHLNNQPKYHGVSYACPYCFAILSVGIDPMTLNEDLKNDILNALRQKTY